MYKNIILPIGLNRCKTWYVRLQKNR